MRQPVDGSRGGARRRPGGGAVVDLVVGPPRPRARPPRQGMGERALRAPEAERAGRELLGAPRARDEAGGGGHVGPPPRRKSSDSENSPGPPRKGDGDGLGGGPSTAGPPVPPPLDVMLARTASAIDDGRSLLSDESILSPLVRRFLSGLGSAKDSIVGSRLYPPIPPVVWRRGLVVRAGDESGGIDGQGSSSPTRRAGPPPPRTAPSRYPPSTREDRRGMPGGESTPAGTGTPASAEWHLPRPVKARPESLDGDASGPAAALDVSHGSDHPPAPPGAPGKSAASPGRRGGWRGDAGYRCRCSSNGGPGGSALAAA